MTGLIILGVILFIILVVVLSSIKIVNTGYLYVVERFGQFYKVLEPGWHIIIPFVDYVRKKVSTKQQILDVPPQSVITKDNVKISVDNVIFYKLLNARDAVYNIEDFRSGIVYSSTTNMRNIIGNMTLDEVLSGRDKINQDLLSIIDEVTDAYGIKILSVEIKNIVPPAEIQQAMEKQMKAERDRRAAILEAEGLKKSAILEAEGEKEAAINKAEGERQAAVLRATGDADARILQAEAEKKAIQLIIEAIEGHGQPDKYLIAVRYLETLKDMVSGENNKVIYMPYQATGVLSSIDGIKEMLTGVKH